MLRRERRGAVIRRSVLLELFLGEWKMILWASTANVSFVILHRPLGRLECIARR